MSRGDRNALFTSLGIIIGLLLALIYLGLRG